MEICHKLAKLAATAASILGWEFIAAIESVGDAD
jgi:hypothetical protein